MKTRSLQTKKTAGKHHAIFNLVGHCARLVPIDNFVEEGLRLTCCETFDDLMEIFLSRSPTSFTVDLVPIPPLQQPVFRIIKGVKDIVEGHVGAGTQYWDDLKKEKL
jgi:hypothetical protein